MVGKEIRGSGIIGRGRRYEGRAARLWNMFVVQMSELRGLPPPPLQAAYSGTPTLSLLLLVAHDPLFGHVDKLSVEIHPSILLELLKMETPRLHLAARSLDGGHS